MGRFFRNNGLSIVLAAIFLALLFGQAVAGWHAFNEENRQHQRSSIEFKPYLKSAHFLEAVFENWESEFLQMAAYVVLTVFLCQRGSAESNDPDETKAEQLAETLPAKGSPFVLRRGGWQLKLYEHSLSLALTSFFLLSFAGHVIGGARLQNLENSEHGEPTVSASEFIGSAQFWFESFQNWQSEFLAVLALVMLSIWLREKHSAESKALNAPHRATGK
jgi:hypothetical protein